MTGLHKRGQCSWALAVFACNEEDRISKALDSIIACGADKDLQVYVIVNGSSDATEKIAREIAAIHPVFQVEVIPLGDKCNAWNHYVYEIVPQADVYFFMDGDVEISVGALDYMAEEFDKAPDINAVGTFQLNGRSKDKYREEWTRHPGVTGNLYALAPSFLDRMVSAGLRLPIGLVGDDSLLGSLAAVDLGFHDDWRYDRIKMCQRAGFYISSMNLLHLDDIRTQHRRMIRYSLRRYQNLIIKRILTERGAGAIPETAEELYAIYPEECGLKWRGYWTWFDFLSLRQIRQSLQNSVSC